MFALNFSPTLIHCHISMRNALGLKSTNREAAKQAAFQTVSAVRPWYFGRAGCYPARSSHLWMARRIASMANTRNAALG
jgi:hypothetical protein